MKHAYLILAHTDFSMLQYLVDAIDDDRNTIFLHVDKKVSVLPRINTRKSKLFFTQKRVNVYWGDFSIVEAEIELFKEALSRDSYEYYHLLSGQDYPIKSQDYIHRFFEEHKGKLFIGYSTPKDNELHSRAGKWIVLTKYLRSDNYIIRGIRRFSNSIQSVISVKRNKDISLRKGPQWCSVTEPFARYIIEQQDEIKHRFKHTFAPDELFIQTLAWNSPFRNFLYNTKDEWDGCLRLIKWEEGVILPFKDSEIEYICNLTKRFFARKFDSTFIESYLGIFERSIAHDN